MADETTEQGVEQGTEQAEQTQPTAEAEADAKMEKDLQDLFNGKGGGRDPESIEEEQPQINQETFGQLQNVAEGYVQFTDALQNGRFADVEAMLQAWNP